MKLTPLISLRFYASFVQSQQRYEVFVEVVKVEKLLLAKENACFLFLEKSENS